MYEGPKEVLLNVTHLTNLLNAQSPQKASKHDHNNDNSLQSQQKIKHPNFHPINKAVTHLITHHEMTRTTRTTTRTLALRAAAALLGSAQGFSLCA